MDITMLINDLLYRMREAGIDAVATTCLSSSGEVISFEIEIVGYLA